MFDVLNRSTTHPFISVGLLLALCLAMLALSGSVVEACRVIARVDVNASNIGADIPAESQLTTGEDDNEGLAIGLRPAILSGLILAFALPHLFHLSEPLPPLLRPPQAPLNN